MDVKKVRVNGEMLKQFAGTQSFVMLIGERTGGDDQVLTMKAADGQEVQVSIADAQDLSVDGNDQSFLEVIGTVNEDCSVAAMAGTWLGNSFDLTSYNQAIGLMQKFPAPFPEMVAAPGNMEE